MGCVHGKSRKSRSPTSPSRGSRRHKGGSVGAKKKDLNSSARLVDDLTYDAHEDKDGDLDGESGDQPTPLYSTLDADSGVPRLSRLSGQFLPPSGSKVARLPRFNYELRYSYLSQRGFYPEAPDKANQDSFCIHTQFGNDPNDHFFGVFDGHGEYGTQCSQFAKKHLCENLLKDRHFRTDSVQAYHAAFTATNVQLHRHNIDDSMSGTTAITVLVRGKTLYVANVGDSRAVLAERRGKELAAVDLSSDQTPFRSDECARVKLCGARVLTLDQLEGLKNPNVQCWGGEEDDDGDPPRLWVADGMFPGTAFTRSIGDKIAEQIGVIAVPEVLVMELTSNHPFFVLASDGVFEFLSSQQVVDMVAEHPDPCNACAAVVAEAYRLWLHYETRTDDITIIVVRLDSLVDELKESADVKAVGQTVELMKNDLSPSREGWRHMETRPVRHEVSGARLRSIESSLHHGAVLESTLETHPKTEDDVVRIEQALKGNFLFNGLTEKQRRVLYDCMERINVHAGDIVIRQGAEDNCFYIVDAGEFEVLVSQAGVAGGQDLGTVVNRYRAETFSCFGELTLMYDKPRESTVRAVTDGSLWSLKREVFRSVLSTQYSHESILMTLRNVEIFSHLTFPQLHRLSESLTKLSFKNGETLITKHDQLASLYVVYQGEVLLSYHTETDMKGNKDGNMLPQEERVLIKEGSCFGEGVLMGESPHPITAVASGDVECWIISKDKFEAVVGPLHDIIQDDLKMREQSASLRKKHAPEVDIHAFDNVKLRDLDGVVYRGISPDILMLDEKGRLQLIDFRFAKKLSDARTSTICGMADYLAPEIINGQSHGFASDWWAMGVLIYFMLQNELPFGSWRESEFDVFARVAQRQLVFPATFSPEVNDLLNKLLAVEENERIGSDERGAMTIKQHTWFDGMDWEGLQQCQIKVPEEIVTRLESVVDSHHLEEFRLHADNGSRSMEDLNSPLWLDEW